MTKFFKNVVIDESSEREDTINYEKEIYAKILSDFLLIQRKIPEYSYKCTKCFK